MNKNPGPKTEIYNQDLGCMYVLFEHFLHKYLVL